MNLALFDFDGTITQKDSFIDFIIFAVGWTRSIIGIIILLPTIIFLLTKIIPNWRAKEKFIACFFNGWDAGKFNKVASKYSRERIDFIIRKKAIDAIRWHQKQNDTVVVVTASADNWIKDWCKINNLELIATKLEFKNNRLTGKLGSKNCYGEEKVRRIRERFNLDDYEIIYAYGDSNGDKMMLDIADIKFYRWKRIDT